jgi:hypothetical protein
MASATPWLRATTGVAVNLTSCPYMPRFRPSLSGAVRQRNAIVELVEYSAVSGL